MLKDSALAAIQESDENISCLKKVEKFLTIFINPVFLKAFVLTFLAEWGDRSQISTVVLAVSTVFSHFVYFLLSKFASIG